MSGTSATIEWLREDSVRLFRQKRFLPKGSRFLRIEDGFRVEWRRSFFFYVVFTPLLFILLGGGFAYFWLYLGTEREFLSPKTVQALTIIFPIAVLLFAGIMLLFGFAIWKRKQGVVFFAARGSSLEWTGGSHEVRPADALFFVTATTVLKPQSETRSRTIWPYGHILIGEDIRRAEHICSFVHGRSRNAKIADLVADYFNIRCHRVALRKPESRMWDEDISRYAFGESMGW